MEPSLSFLSYLNLFGERLNFYLVRFKKANFLELIYRVKQALFIYRLRSLFGKGKVTSVTNCEYTAIGGLKLPEFQYDVSNQVLTFVKNGGVFTLNGNRGDIERFEQRNRGVFFADVPMPVLNFDIRNAWEPARLQHLTILLLFIHYYPVSLDIADIQSAAKNIVIEWIDKNPFLAGPHYLSAMECGLRIPVFFYTLKVLNNLKFEEKNRILRTIQQHSWWIYRRLSLYSSLGNHTICECVGLVFAGTIFSSTSEGKAWVCQGLSILEQELHHQILNDGGPAEQSFGYLRFILDLYWLVIGLMEKNRLHDCRKWKQRLRLGENFLQAFQDVRGQVPFIGDNDDGYAVAPGIHPMRDRNM